MRAAQADPSAQIEAAREASTLAHSREEDGDRRRGGDCARRRGGGREPASPQYPAGGAADPPGVRLSRGPGPERPGLPPRPGSRGGTGASLAPAPARGSSDSSSASLPPAPAPSSSWREARRGATSARRSRRCGGPAGRSPASFSGAGSSPSSTPAMTAGIRTTRSIEKRS